VTGILNKPDGMMLARVEIMCKKSALLFAFYRNKNTEKVKNNIYERHAAYC